MQLGFRRDRSTIIPPHIYHLKSNIRWPVSSLTLLRLFESVPRQAFLNKLHQRNIPPVVLVAIQLSVRPFPASGSEWNLFILASCYLLGAPGILPWATVVPALCKWHSQYSFF